jgi:flavin-dependent dehydrogenase
MIIAADGPESSGGRWAGLRTSLKPKDMNPVPSLKWQEFRWKNQTA